MPTWSTGIALQGTNGLSVLTGSGAPASSLGVAQQAYIDLASAILYVKTSSGWPGSGTSLVGPASTTPGPQGLSVQSGSGAPSSSIGNVGDTYLDTTNAVLYAAKTSSGYPASGKSLVGPASTVAGPQGVSLQNGSGAPASSVGNVGDAYLDTTNGVLYAAKTSSGYPTPGKSIVGTNGLNVQSGSGAPASTLGNVGDIYVDTTNAVLYPAKTASGYGTGKSLVGPAGSSSSSSTVGSSGLTFNDGTVQNTAFPGAIALGTTTASTGPSVWYNGGSLTSTAVLMQTTGATTTQYFQPPTASGFYGCLAVNFNTSAAAIYVQLYNQTDGAAVWTSPSSIASGTVTNYGPFAISTYPMTANKQYVWRISGSGTTYANVLPQYFVPSATPYATQYPTPSMITTATTLSSTAYNCRLPGNNTLTQYYRFAAGGFFTYASFQNFSTTTAAVFLLQNSAGTTIYTSPSVAAGATTTVGPFGPGAYYLAANTSYMWSVTGSGSATVLINWAYVG